MKTKRKVIGKLDEDSEMIPTRGKPGRPANNKVVAKNSLNDSGHAQYEKKIKN